jgi:energy-coupling factor transporter transmembrane protein EcfT
VLPDPLSLLIVMCLLATSLVLTTSPAGAASGHARVRMPDVVGTEPRARSSP